jgi:hypothetical protein
MAKKVEIKEIEPIEPAKLDEITEKLQPSSDARRRSAKHWRIGRIFWGLLLVLIGGLILASNYGLVSVNWFNLWRLWPLFIVAIGLFVLTVRGLAGRLLSVVFVIMALGAVVYALVYAPQNSQQTSIYNITSQEIDSATTAEINLKTGLGQLDINTADQVAVAQARLESNISNLTNDTSLAGTTQITNISTNAISGWSDGNIDNRLSVNMTRSLPIRLNLDIGASNITADLSLARLQNLSIKSGATKSDIKLGDKEDLTTVSLDSRASSFLIRVPSSSGASVKLDGVTSNNFDGLIKNGDTYESTNYESATKRINIVGRLGLASFTLERY